MIKLVDILLENHVSKHKFSRTSQVFQAVFRKHSGGRMTGMKAKRKIFVAGTICAVAIALGIGAAVLQNRAMAQSRAGVQAPIFEVNPMWPKPLPNNWVMGMTIGVAVDAQDHVWVLHRPESIENNLKAAGLNPPISGCC